MHDDDEPIASTSNAATVTEQDGRGAPLPLIEDADTGDRFLIYKNYRR